MPDRNRFERDLDIDDPSVEAVSRFDRIDREIDLVDAKVMSGSSLEAKAENGRVVLSLRPGPTGRYPAFRTGLLSLGEALGGELLEDVEGSAPGLDPIDRALLDGATLTVERLGDKLMATWVRSLPNRTFTHEGKEHKVYRRGTRKAHGLKVSQVALAALDSKEVVTEGSCLS